jgi:hypothetical protein
MAKISINLASPASLSKAIAKVSKMASTATTLSNKIVHETTEKLLTLILANGAGIGSGEMLSSIHTNYVMGANGCEIGQILGADYIIYIEYGTGVVGKGTNPNAPADWDYASGEHVFTTSDGKIGWYYYNEDIDRVVFTEGMRARPFMRPAFEQVLVGLPETVRVRFEEWTHTT